MQYYENKYDQRIAIVEKLIDLAKLVLFPDPKSEETMSEFPLMFEGKPIEPENKEVGPTKDKSVQRGPRKKRVDNSGLSEEEKAEKKRLYAREWWRKKHGKNDDAKSKTVERILNRAKENKVQQSPEEKRYHCYDCGQVFFETGKVEKCISCGSTNFLMKKEA